MANPFQAAFPRAWHLVLSGVFITAFGGVVIGDEVPLTVLEPAEAKAVVPRKPERERWSWNQANVKFTPEGDLLWAPRPFKFEAGKSVRYIDFDAGKDDNDGASKETAWKHHPWDPAAAGHAKEAGGAQTYVFKRGVVYRGTLTPHGDAGEDANPIRLTSDPAWGTGDAVISGAETVTGWKKGIDRKDIPEGEKVWWVDLPYAPRNVWEIRPEGVERVALARTPNWKVSDPEDVMSEWWTWDQPNWWTNANHIDFQGHRAHIGIDAKNLNKTADYYVGADVRTEFGIVMGTPFPTRVEGYDPAKKGLIFQGIWFGDSEQIMTNNRYYLEDKPQYLDSPGEFWFDNQGDHGRLYLRLPDDRDPNQSHVEAGHYINLLDTDSLKHVAITGLTFQFFNTYWDLTQPSWGNKDVDNAAIRINGSAVDLRVANCKFYNIPRAVQIDATSGDLDRIVIEDNDIQHTDHGSLTINAGGHGDLKILRNRMFDIAGRPQRQEMGHALVVNYPVTMEIAGNFLDRCYGAGIFIRGGKADQSTADAPLVRTIIHGNRATNTLLSANDWGGIEPQEGGPAYVYNNISGNANGLWNWAYDPAKGRARLGYTYYLDGGFKTYLFNNVAWGLTSDPLSKHCADAAVYEAGPTFENTFFNNTFYDFAHGTSWTPVGGRHLVLGNIWSNIAKTIFVYGQSKEDSGPRPDSYEYSTAGIGFNVFTGILPAGDFGVFETDGTTYADPASLAAAMKRRCELCWNVGEVAGKPVMRDPDKHDFRLLGASPATEHGVRVFVPWGLSRNVGEWQFRRNNEDPTVLLDNHWYLAPYYVSRNDYYRAPTNPLKAVNITAKDYGPGPLEDWTDAALTLNGKDQYAALSNADMIKPYEYDAAVNGAPTKMKVEGKELSTPDIDTGNMLIEAHFKTAPGLGACVLVSKMADAGYQLAVNKAGGLTVTLQSGGQKAELASGAIINDGRWHHVIAEIDRTAGTGAIYVDGIKTVGGPIALAKDASLSNSADFLLGKGPNGNFFTGTIDFLRICRGTLADSKTTIEELYDWEFDGPQLRDLVGHEVTGKRHDAGAFQAG